MKEESHKHWEYSCDCLGGGFWRRLNWELEPGEENLYIHTHTHTHTPIDILDKQGNTYSTRNCIQ